MLVSASDSVAAALGGALDGLSMRQRVAADNIANVDTPGFNDEYKPEALQHAEALEVYRGIDDLDWTVVSPAAYIHPGERTGRYRLGGDRMLLDSSGNSEVSAEDYAVAIADLLEQDGHARERVGVAW